MADLNLGQHRGAYVRLTYRTRRDQNSMRIITLDGSDPYAWSEVREREGILTFKFDGRPRLNHTDIGVGQIEVLSAEELWKPPKDAIKRVCSHCAKTHPLTVALIDARVLNAPESCTTVELCDICRTHKDSFGGLPMSMIHHIPPKYWKFSASAEPGTIEAEMLSAVFFRKMVDQNSTMVLTDMQRNQFYSSRPKFRSIWSNEDGERFEVWSNQPFPAMDWERGLSMPELCKCAVEIVACINQAVIHKAKV